MLSLKRALISAFLVLLACVAALLVFVCVVTGGIPRWVSSGFATSAYLHFDINGKPVSKRVTNPDDLNALKGILRGWSYPDEPSCGFGLDESITLTDGRKTVTFCPACDFDPTIQIGNTHLYIAISEKKRKHLDEILRRYGMEVHE
jgi:hypothetical protein